MSVRNEQNMLKVRVKSILETDELSRDSDDRLYLAVLYQISAERGINLVQLPVTSFFSQRKAYGFPSYESVGRCRRKLQEDDESLCSTEQVERMRAKREKEYEEWAVTN